MCCAHAGSTAKLKGATRPKSQEFMRGFQRVKSPATPKLSNVLHDAIASPSNLSDAEPDQSSDNKQKRNSVGSSSVPVWMQDPEPMSSWTVQQQRIFISQLNEHPQSRKHPDHLRIAIEKTHRLMPDKTIQEIEECYKHLQVKRIAYYGPVDRKRSLSKK